MALLKSEKQELDYALKTLNFLEHISDSQFKKLQEKFTKVRFNKGDSVLLEGRSGRAFFILYKGRISVWGEKDDGELTFVAEINPISYFGEIAILEGSERTATLIAEEPIETFIIGKEDFIQLLFSIPGIKKMIEQKAGQRKKDKEARVRKRRTKSDKEKEESILPQPSIKRKPIAELSPPVSEVQQIAEILPVTNIQPIAESLPPIAVIQPPNAEVKNIAGLESPILKIQKIININQIIEIEKTETDVEDVELVTEQQKSLTKPIEVESEQKAINIRAKVDRLQPVHNDTDKAEDGILQIQADVKPAIDILQPVNIEKDIVEDSSDEIPEIPAGLIRTFIGKGKGKTWAALGLVLRAVAFGMKAHVVQFLKSQTTSEPLSLLEMHLPLFKIDTFGQHCPFKDLLKNTLIHCNECKRCYVDPKIPKGIDKEIAEMAFEMCEGVARSGLYDILVMDEVLRALEYKLIEAKKIIRFLREKPKNLEIILTGPKAPSEIVRISNSVTYLVPVKRPLGKEIKPRLGIDY